MCVYTHTHTYRIYEFLFKNLDQARPLLTDFAWIFVPINRWDVLRRELDSKSAYRCHEENLKLDSSLKIKFVALNAHQVVMTDKTYMLDNIKGGMVTEGVYMCVYVCVYVCMYVCVCMHVL